MAGNVRELKHAIERAVLVASDGVLRLRDLPAEITSLSRRQSGDLRVLLESEARGAAGY